MDITISLITTLVLTLINGYFSMSEMALTTAKRAVLEHEASAAVFGGAATVPAGPAHEGGLPLVDGAGEDPGATVAMPAMPQE